MRRLALALVALGTFAVLLFAGLFSGGNGGPGAAAHVATGAPSAPEAAPEEPPAPDAPRTPEAPPAERKEAHAPPAPEAPAADVAFALVEARIVDSFGAPLPGARLRSGRSEALAGGDGIAALRLSPPRPPAKTWEAALEASARGCATRFLEAEAAAGRTTRLGDVVLHPGGAVVGRVVDPGDRGVPGAGVRATEASLSDFDAEWARYQGPGDGRDPEGTSGEDGSFRIEGVTPGFSRIWAHAEGSLYSFSSPVEVRAGAETAEVRLVLEPIPREDRIEGVVLSPAGEPVPHARLSYAYRTENMSGSGGEMADEAGRFRLVLHPRAPRDLRASDPAERWADAVQKGVAPGTLDVRLQLSLPRWIELRVRDASGDPVVRYGAYVRPSDVPHVAGTVPGDAHEGGLVRLRVPPEPFLVCVNAEGFEELDLGPLEPESAPASLECRLVPLPGVSGRVFAGGKPLPAAKVALLKLAEPGTRIEHNGFPTRVHPNPKAEDEADGEGRFRMTLREDGRFLVCAFAEGFADAEAGPFDLRASAGASEIEVVLGPGGAIEGRVLPPPGADVNGLVVAANRGDGRARTLRVGSDGRYRFERLTPGKWMVEERETLLDPHRSTTGVLSDLDAKEFEVPWVCEVFEGQTTVYDLDLSGRGGRALLGELALDGEPAGGWTATLRPLTGGFVITDRDRQTTATDRLGRFTIPFPAGERFRLTLESDPGRPASIRLTDVVASERGENAWRRDLATGRLEGERASPGAEPLHALWSGPGSLLASIPIPFDAEGRFALPRVPAGRVRIARPTKGDPDSDPAGWAVVAEAEVAAGRTATVSVF